MIDLYLYFPTDIRPATVSAVPRIGETVYLDTGEQQSIWKVVDVEHRVRPGSQGSTINVHLEPATPRE
ncbi:hypothetical protein OS965_02645 [Streptomyces sp. H27-G5]|uniref:hypothetical protein n=1 Tax=Streptomyces sp. H27-G5 TaxID=2996698 RepID=UPI00226E3AD4|nr:hypothetical protein [Streptomyces sp. H27-G5]MCY0917076.1 hypothetical protein [Streptomyces sp. H27-G5]